MVVLVVVGTQPLLLLPEVQEVLEVAAQEGPQQEDQEIHHLLHLHKEIPAAVLLLDLHRNPPAVLVVVAHLQQETITGILRHREQEVMELQ